MHPRVIGANLVVSVKSFYRERAAVFFRLAFPVLLILVFGAISMEGDHLERSGPSPIISAAASRFVGEYRFIEFFVPGIIAMAVMSASLFGAVNVNAELRQKGILRKLSTTPITRTEWILSNILYQFVLAALTTILILLVSYGVFQVRLKINAWLPVFVLLNVFTFVGLGMLLTRVAREAESAAAAANAVMFPMMFLSGTFFPVELLPKALQTIAGALPLYYINEGLRAAMVRADHPAAGRSALVSGVFAVAVLALGVRITRLREETS